MTNDKISAAGMAVLLALSRLFTEATSLPGENIEYGMQRFTVILLSFLLTAVLYVPLAAVSERSGGASPVALIAGRSKLLSGFTGVLLSVYLLFCASETAMRSHYYAVSTVLDSAPSVYFCILTGAAVLYAVHKGLEASSRTGTITAAILGMLLLLILCALFHDIRSDRLYPALIDNRSTFLKEVAGEFSLNSEYLVLAALYGNVRGKRGLTVTLYLGGSCLAMLLMTFLYSTVFGRLASRLEFPFYMLSSISDLNLLHRINGIDVTVWIMAGLLRLALFALAFGSVARTCFVGENASKRARLVFAAAAVGLAELFAAFPELYSPIKQVCVSGLPLLFAAVFLCAAAFLCTVGRKEKSA